MSCTSCLTCPRPFTVASIDPALVPELELAGPVQLVGRFVGPAYPTRACPQLRRAETHCQECGEVLSLYGHCALCRTQQAA